MFAILTINNLMVDFQEHVDYEDGCKIIIDQTGWVDEEMLAAVRMYKSSNHYGDMTLREFLDKMFT